MSNTIYNNSIIFLNKTNNAFSLINNIKIQNYRNELSQIQNEIYEMMINYNIYRRNFNNINYKILDIMYLKLNLLN